MNTLVLFMATATLGIDVGWEPLADGGHEYTIQIEPELLSVLSTGTDVVSEVPPQVDVRRYRVTVGRGQLSRIDGPPRPTQTARTSEPADTSPRSLEQPPSWNDDTADPPAPLPLASDGQGSRERESRTDASETTYAAATTNDVNPSYRTERPTLPSEQPRAWWPLVLCAILLAISVSANIYLGMVAREARTLYRDTVARYRGARTA